MRQHDLSAARAHLDKCLSLRPRDGRALLLAAQSARRLEDAASAERLLSAFEEAHGTTQESRFEWLLLGVQQGDLADHERALHAAVEHGHADSVLMLEALARGYGTLMRWSSRAHCLDTLVERAPEHAPALVLRGETWQTLNEPEKALADYERAVRLAPKDAAAQRALADFLCRLGETRRAVYHFEIARRLKPSDPAILLGLARCRFDFAELDRTQELLDQILASDPEHVEGLVERGRLALRRGQAAQAEGFLARALRTAPWHRTGQRDLCLCLVELGKSSAAEACREQLRKLEAEDVLLGRLTLRFGDAPRDPDLRLEVALLLLRNGQPEMARGWLMTVLAVAPRHRLTHAVLAAEFDKLGQPRRAAHHRRLAGESAP
jgi:Tfp pilus assembly protein PilF